jgi:chorismate mutase
MNRSRNRRLAVAAVRGAIAVKANTRAHLERAVRHLLQALVATNRLEPARRSGSCAFC